MDSTRKTRSSAKKKTVNSVPSLNASSSSLSQSLQDDYTSKDYQFEPDKLLRHNSLRDNPASHQFLRNSTYLPSEMALNFKSTQGSPSRRSRSAHSSWNTSPHSKQRKANSPLHMETSSNFLSGSSDQSDLNLPTSSKLSTKQFRNMDLFNNPKPYSYEYSDFKSRTKIPSTGPMKALHDLGKFKTADLDLTLQQRHSLKLQERSVVISPFWQFLLFKYHQELTDILEEKLQETILLNVKKNKIIFHCVQVGLVESFFKSVPFSIQFDPQQRSWLKANSKRWQTLIKDLQKKYTCAIFTEDDFAETHVCAIEGESELIHSELSGLLNQNYNDIKISPHVKKFLDVNKEFSDLKLETSDRGELWIRHASESRLGELMEKLGGVSCQSYIIDEKQFQLLNEWKKDELVQIEREFKVKSCPYQLERLGDSPLVFHVNQIISISCVVNKYPEKIPADTLIFMDWQTTTQAEPLEIIPSSKWDSPTGKCFQIRLAKHVKTSLLLKEVLRFIFSQEILPVTIVFFFPPTFAFQFSTVCTSLIKVLRDPPLHLKGSSRHHIMLTVPEETMKRSANEVMTNDPSPSFVVKVFVGNLEDQQVNVIVNSTNENLDLEKGQIASSLLSKAGPALQRECRKKYPRGISYPQFAVTKGHNLPCNYIIHGALPYYTGGQEIKEFVYRCLEHMESIRAKSIAFPALGTGVLKYPLPEVVKQIKKAFKKFHEIYTQTHLEEVLIVLYTEEMGMDLFYELDNSKNGPGLTSDKSLESPSNSMNWVQFVNYSGQVENLSLAISFIENKLKQATFLVKIPENEFEDVLFFKDLHLVIPGIVEQLNNKSGSFYHLNLPDKSTKDLLKSSILEVKKNLHREHLNINPPRTSSILEHCVLKTQQNYPYVKCIVASGCHGIVIQSLDWNQTQAAKYFIEMLLGMKILPSVSEDRFDKVESFRTISTSRNSLPPGLSPDPFQQRSYSIHNSDFAMEYPDQKNVTIPSHLNISCFQTESGLVVKVYQGDLLKVDVQGIINAANKWLSHGGGVAKAIITAAGDAVNTEGQLKLNGRTLDDGEVLSTSAGNLKRYKNIIHAVGPMYSNNGNYCIEKITLAVFNSLQEAKKLNLQSVALPALSSAIFGVPMDICTQGYFLGLRNFSERFPNSSLKEVHFVDKQESRVQEIQKFFHTYLIAIDPQENIQSLKQSPKNLLQSPLASKNSSNDGSKDGSKKGSNDGSKPPAEICPICFERIKKAKTLWKCFHTFCEDCISQSFAYRPKCPVCGLSYGIETGQQPPGTMSLSKLKFSLPGFKKKETFQIDYRMKHPQNKGSIQRTAYLPGTTEGQVILKMLQLAFQRGLIFTVGESRTTGAQNVITWNDIHHKTSIDGGPAAFGYPDPTYFLRVTEELADHGITPDDVQNLELQKYLNWL